MSYINDRHEDFFPGIVSRGDSHRFFPQSEVVASIARPEFKAKSENEIRSFPYQYQGKKSACVAYTIAKILTILYYLKTNRIVKFSPTPIYSQRVNKPGEGMIFSDARMLAGRGTVPDTVIPSDELTEEEMTNYELDEIIKNAADGFAVSEDWVELPIDFDVVASTIEKTGKGIMLWFYFGPKEFFGIKIPKSILSVFTWWRHSVTGVDAFSRELIEYLRIEDSADKEHLYKKDINREFFNSRCILAAYPIEFKFETKGGATYNGTLISLQKCLQSQGFFPMNVPFAERLGPVTRDSLKKFQTKYGLQVTGTLTEETRYLIEKMF